MYPASNPVSPVANVLTPGWNELNLSTNTAYGVQVTAIVNGLESPLSPPTTVYTFAAVPATAVFSAVTNNSFTISWDPTVNPADTRFEVSRSTDNFVLNISTPIQIISGFTNTTTTFVGLASGTTYYLRIRAANGDGFLTGFLGPVSTQTLSDPPTGLVGMAMGVSSITWTWNPVVGASSYQLYIASSPSTLVGTSFSTSFDDLGLSTNTAYGRVVLAVNAGGSSALSASATTYTQAAVPGQPSFNTVGYSSFTVTWSTDTNPAGTHYEVSRSTDNFVVDDSTPIVFSSSFTANTTTFINLVPATTYYVRVRAINGDNLWITTFSVVGSTRTLDVPVPSTLVGVALGVSSISWNWGLVVGAQSYNVYPASNPVSPVANVSSPPWPELNLSTNVAYGVQATAVVNGVESALTLPTTVYTFAAIPSVPVPSQVSYSSFTITWGANQNPITTPFEVSISSVSSFATAVSTPIALTDGFTSVTTAFMNLLPSTTYYFRIRAANGDMIASSFSVVGSTRTLDVPMPANLVGLALGVSSISWNWGTVIGASSYNVYPASNPVSAVANVLTPGWNELNLSTNTAYGVQVTAIVNGLESPLTVPTTVYTLAAVPGPLSISGVTATQFITQWLTNGNTGFTPYEVSLSTDIAFVLAVSTPVTFADNLTGNSTNFSNLNPSTTYYVRVRGRNGDGFVTDFSAIADTQTLSIPPSNFQGAALGVSSISWTWNAVGGATSYNIYAASNPVTPIGSTSTLNWIETGLSTNTSYGRQVTAIVNSIESGLSNSATTYTFAAPVLGSELTGITPTTVGLTWNANGNPAGTLFTAELSVQANFATVTTSATVITTATFSGLLSNATYYLHAKSQNGDGFATAFDTTLSTITPAAVPVNGTIAVVGGSSITIAWGGSTNISGTLVQAELSTISLVGASTQTFVTSAFSADFFNLLPNTTYYARVKALGWAGADSAYLLIGQAETSISAPTNVRFIDVELSSVTAAWDASPQPNVQYVAELADPSNPFGVPLTSTTLGTTAGFSVLNVNTKYYFRVRSQDLSSLTFSIYSSTISTFTLASPPTSLSTTSVTSNAVGLAWLDGGNPSGTLFSLERSTDGINFAVLTTQTGLTYSDTSVSAGTTYMYRVRAVNGDNVPSAPSNSVLVTTLGTPVAPKRPSGLWIERVDAGGGNFNMTYHWHAVTERTDGSALSNLSGYQIYTSASLLTPRAQWTLVTTVGGTSWPTTANTSVVNYYSLKAIDANGLQSDWTEILDDSADMDHVYMYGDNISRVTLPQSAANVMRLEKNTYGADLWMDLEEEPADETGRVVRSMKIVITNTVTNNEVTDLIFNPPVLHGVLAYSVQNGNVVSGAPEPAGFLTSAKIPVITAANAAQQLSLFWYDGAEWIKTTGMVNSQDNTVSFTGSRVGSFQIRAATHGTGATLTRVYPRIITPNGDGWNDKAIFQFDNPQLLPLSGKVYDITGALVASLQIGPNPDSTLSWDGKSSGGTVVPGGIYIYQIDLGGTSESGTIVVAR